MLKAVFFDFDGVIIDSFEHVVIAFQRTLVYFGHASPSPKILQKLYGYTAINALKELLPSSDKLYHAKLFERFVIESNNVTAHIKLFKHAEKIIKDLSTTYKLGVVSSRRTYSVNDILSRHSLQDYFSVVIGKDDVVHHKPHPEPILKALEHLDVKATESIYIGDMKEDVLAAKAASVPSIFISGKRTEHHGADYVVKKIEEIPKIIIALG